jgi:antitoxin component HigA of HigAB toxin-antitoxin module
MAADIKPIRTDADHEAALLEVERLWGAPSGTPAGDRLDVLATLIDAGLPLLRGLAVLAKQEPDPVLRKTITQLADGVQVVGRPSHDVASAVRLIEACRLALEVGEEVVAQVVFDLARRADDDLPRDVQEHSRSCGDSQQAHGMEENLLLCRAVPQVINCMTDDDRDQHL